MTYWYRQHIGECPLCRKDTSYRTRVDGKKPKDEKLIYEAIPFAETYCCRG